MEGQQVFAAFYRRVGVLFEGQGNVEPEAVFQACTGMGCRHDAAACTGDHHHVGAGQFFTQLCGLCVQRMFHWCTGGAEHSDFAAALEALEHPKGFVQFAQGLQRYLDVPAVTVILGHAQHR